jgi:hypothetical protein
MPARKLPRRHSNFRGVRQGYRDTSVAVAVCVTEPSVPLTVNRYVPFATERAAVMVRVVDEPPAGLGENVAVTPEGRPLLTDIVSKDEKLPVRVMATE